MAGEKKIEPLNHIFTVDVSEIAWNGDLSPVRSAIEYCICTWTMS